MRCSEALVAAALSVGIVLLVVDAGPGSAIGAEVVEAEADAPPARRMADVGEGNTEARPSVLHVSSLAGVWLQVGDPDWLGLLVWFDQNERTFAIDDSGRLPAGAAARGTFELAGDTIVFTSRGSSLCNEHDTWEWRANRSKASLHVVHTRSSAPPCWIPTGTEWTFIRVSPHSAASDRAHRRDREMRPPIPEDVHPSDRRFYIQ
jgi:hypothetical protein